MAEYSPIPIPWSDSYQLTGWISPLRGWLCRPNNAACFDGFGPASVCGEGNPHRRLSVGADGGWRWGQGREADSLFRDSPQSWGGWEETQHHDWLGRRDLVVIASGGGRYSSGVWNTGPNRLWWNDKQLAGLPDRVRGAWVYQGRLILVTNPVLTELKLIYATRAEANAGTWHELDSLDFTGRTLRQLFFAHPDGHAAASIAGATSGGGTFLLRAALAYDEQTGIVTGSLAMESTSYTGATVTEATTVGGALSAYRHRRYWFGEFTDKGGGNYTHAAGDLEQVEDWPWPCRDVFRWPLDTGIQAVHAGAAAGSSVNADLPCEAYYRRIVAPGIEVPIASANPCPATYTCATSTASAGEVGGELIGELWRVTGTSWNQYGFTGTGETLLAIDYHPETGEELRAIRSATGAALRRSTDTLDADQPIVNTGDGPSWANGDGVTNAITYPGTEATETLTFGGESLELRRWEIVGGTPAPAGTWRDVTILDLRYGAYVEAEAGPVEDSPARFLTLWAMGRSIDLGAGSGALWDVFPSSNATLGTSSGARGGELLVGLCRYLHPDGTYKFKTAAFLPPKGDGDASIIDESAILAALEIDGAGATPFPARGR